MSHFEQNSKLFEYLQRHTLFRFILSSLDWKLYQKFVSQPMLRRTSPFKYQPSGNDSKPG